MVDAERWVDAEDAISSMFQLCGVTTGKISPTEEALLAEEQRAEENELIEAQKSVQPGNEDPSTSSAPGKKLKKYNLRGVMEHAKSRLAADELKKKTEEEKKAKEQSWIPLRDGSTRSKIAEELDHICSEDVSRLVDQRHSLRLPSIAGSTMSEEVVRGFLGRHLYLLAFAQHSLGKRRLAEGHYRRSIACLDNAGDEYSAERAVARLNFGELLASLHKMAEAELVAGEAIEAVKDCYGVKSEWFGAAKSNLGTYMCAQSKFDEAKETCFEALTVLHDALGADNELTQSALQNCMAVIKKTDPGALEDFKRKWGSVGENDLEDMRSKGVGASDEQIADALNRFKAGVEAKSLDPRGWMKDMSFSKEELKRFLDHQDSVGEPVDADMAHAVARELAAITKSTPFSPDDDSRGGDDDVDDGAQVSSGSSDPAVEKAFEETINNSSAETPQGVDLEALDEHSDQEGGIDKLKRDMWVADQQAEMYEEKSGKSHRGGE